MLPVIIAVFSQIRNGWFFQVSQGSELIMGFGIKVVNKVTGEVFWPFPLNDVREVIMEHGSTDAFVKKLQLQEKYPEDQYSIYIVQGNSLDSATSTLWVP